MTDGAISVGDAAAISAAGERRQRLRQILRSGAFLVGIVILLFWVFCALFGPWIVPYDPFAADPLNALLPPSAEHWFGTEQLGRDVFSRVIVGSRDILTIAPLATLLGTVGGTILGLAMGYFRGWIDEAVSRVVDALLALPTVLIALLALVALGPSNTTVVLVIAFTFAPLIARTVRAAVLVERELDYVAAAELRREGALYVMFVEILPNILPPILVETTVRLGYAIFTVATLSFIGFGIQPPSPDWGLSISTNYGMISAGAWWAVAFDGLAIASLVVAVNLVADGIQSAFDG
jgi:peptide/nickel transport system permease protein